MAVPDISALTDAVLIDHFGEPTFERGRMYWSEGRAQVLTSTPGSLVGSARGSNNRRYTCRVLWARRGDGFWLDGTCTCPVLNDCKHCVALVLTARPRRQVTEITDWRAALTPLLAAADAPPTDDSPIALKFVLQESRGFWGSRSMLRIRPMVTGRGGRRRWVKTGASWAELTSPYLAAGQQRLNPRQRDALAAMGRPLARLAERDEGTISINDFGADLWEHLDRVRAAGVVFLDADEREGAVVVEPERAVGAIDVVRLDDGALRVTGCARLGDELITLGEDTPLIGDPPHGFWTVDEVSGTTRLIGFTEPLRRELVGFFLGGPVQVPARHADEYLREMHPRLARVAPVLSHDHTVDEPVVVTPTLRLQVDFDTARTARLTWYAVYDQTAHPLAEPAPHGQRDLRAEHQLVEDLPLSARHRDLLQAHGGSRSTAPLPDLTLTAMAVVELTQQVVPELNRAGVDVVLVDAPTIAESVHDPIVHLSIADIPDSHDWFDLSVEVTVGGEPVPFGELFAALAAGEDTLLLPSGTWLRLDRPEFGQLRDLIAEARGLTDTADSDTIAVSRYQVDLWDELVALGVVEEQSRRWQTSVDSLRSLSTVTAVPVPSRLRADLRPYQLDGFSWLAQLYDHRLGGILADDMGLGKTLQTIALFCRAHDADPDARHLVVAPTSVVDNWRREIERFAPHLQVATISASGKRRGSTLAEAVGQARVVVTSYALFRIENAEYRAMTWDTLVLDEAQFVKNRQGKTYQCARRLGARSTFAITGTPMENSLMDLWSLLSIVAPGLYPDPKRFAATYREPIESGRDVELLSTLRRRIAPLMRRRTKDEVLTELPAKTEQVVAVEMSPRHARIYSTRLQRERQKVLGLVDDLTANRFAIFRSLTLLRQLSLDPGLVDEEYDDVGSAKIDQLVDHLTEVIDEGHRALVFSQFTRYLARVADRLDHEGIAHAYLDGSTRDRAGVVSAFKDGDAPVFLISLKAGGVGLNLTEADYCFVLDPWWNPAVENQAIDRAHRIGQERPVMVYRYVSEGTIEEKVMELKAGKQALFDSVVDADGALSGALSAADIRGLFD